MGFIPKEPHCLVDKGNRSGTRGERSWERGGEGRGGEGLGEERMVTVVGDVI